MKVFGRAFPTREVTTQFVIGTMFFVGASSFALYVQRNNDAIRTHNEQTISNMQANVDDWLTKIHSDVSDVKNALSLYNAYVAAHPNDTATDTIGTENDLASGIFTHQFDCQNLIEDYNKQKWPSYVKTETHSILECNGK